MLDKVLYVILAVVVLGTLGTPGYVFAKPGARETFTEFYILGPEGKAINYPLQLKVGKEETLIFGIINRKYEIVSYLIEIRPEGIISSKLGSIVLEHNERLEQSAIITPDKPGTEQKVEFSLYKQGQTEAYQSLNL